MAHDDAPDFSPLAAIYASTRPGYPADLYAWLAGQVRSHELAWDTSTGNGQAAVGLLSAFRLVAASDLSMAQLRHAPPRERMVTWAGRAERSPLVSGSADLVVAAAAVHWFDLDAFWTELTRVTRSGGVFAAWTYHVGHVEGEHAPVVAEFCATKVRSYFGSGAALVDDRYEGIHPPGTALDAPRFHVAADWTLDQLAGFVRSWSAVRKCTEETGRDPVVDLVAQLGRTWSDPERPSRFRWPIYLKATRL